MFSQLEEAATGCTTVLQQRIGDWRLRQATIGGLVSASLCASGGRRLLHIATGGRRQRVGGDYSHLLSGVMEICRMTQKEGQPGR